MADNASRYRMEELQDHKGNVVYPHTDADVVWMGDESVGTFLKKQATDEEITAALID